MPPNTASARTPVRVVPDGSLPTSDEHLETLTEVAGLDVVAASPRGLLDAVHAASTVA